MFQITEHDFGSVARGAEAEFPFVLTNIYLEDVHLSGVRTSCGCTTPRIQSAWLKTHESGAIIAKFNTDSFSGRRGATITVTLDKPFPAQVQLHVKGYIRRDVEIQPGSVQLGSVEEGTAAEKTVTVSYTGWNNWEITAVRRVSPHLSVVAEKVHRGRGRVAYELSVRLDENARPGYLREHLTLVTNDPQSSEIPLLVEGVVQPGIMVSPESLFMGVVKPGEKVTKQIIVRGKRPFRIVSVTCDGGRFELETSAESGPKPLHLIPITFVAGEIPGRVSERILIETDLGSTVSELSASAVVAGAGSGF